MRREIADMGARTPHELMRAVEVSFIRDCAEMAARSSLTRTDRAGASTTIGPTCRAATTASGAITSTCEKTPTGEMVFLKRPVAPYFISVPELDGLPPTDQTVQQVQQPPLVGGQAPATTWSRIAQTATAFDPPSPRIAEVLALDEPTIDDLRPYLADADAGVRRTAVATLTEHTPDGCAPELFAALDDTDASVRRTSADGIRELVEVLPGAEAARAHLTSGDSVVRAAAVYLLAARRAGDTGQYRGALHRSRSSGAHRGGAGAGVGGRRRRSCHRHRR